MRPLLTAAAAAAALLVGLVSGTAGTLLHALWWGLALGLTTALVVMAWLPPGPVRLAYAVGWCLPVLRGALERPGGGFLVAADAAGWSLLGGSAVLLLASLATVASGRPARRTRGDTDDRARAEDHEMRGAAT